MSISNNAFLTADIAADIGTLVSPLEVPLVLDLDKTLLRTDMLWECFAGAIRRDPTTLARAPLWALQGRAVLKHKLAERAAPDVDVLPVDEAVVALAETEAARGRLVVLATAADELVARRIARRFPFITKVIASDGQLNLKGERKAEALAAAFPQGFAYAGDSVSDLPVWRAAVEIVLVGVSRRLAETARALDKPTLELSAEPLKVRTIVKAIRAKQWAKNGLIFAPVPLAGMLGEPSAWAHAALAFLALGLLASATYLVNDLFDLSDDRRHWTKRERPLASGALPISVGMMLVPLLALGGLGLAAASGLPVLLGVLGYTATTLAYSFGLKRVPILDVTILAGLFTLRLFLGVVAIGAVISPWLFVFSMTLFLSLSTAKRHTEVVRMREHGQIKAAGRGYVARDESFLLALGMASAVASLVVLTQYLTVEAFRQAHYAAPAFLWGAPIVLFVWLGRVWLLSQRGELDDDPVAFALKDRASLALGAVLAVVFAAASFV